MNYAGAPHCLPSRVVLMLGKSSYRVGMYDIVGRGEMELPEKETTIAELMRDAGYATYHGGKWHIALSHARRGNNPSRKKEGSAYSNSPQRRMPVPAPRN